MKKSFHFLCAIFLCCILLDNVFSQTGWIIDARMEAKILSNYTGEHIWNGGTKNGYADGEGELIIYKHGSWIGREREISIYGMMNQGVFDGWAESYYYNNSLYWLGPVKNQMAEGCGLGAGLDKYGGRNSDSLVMQKRAKGIQISDPSNECSQELEKNIASKAGGKLGKLVIKCFLDRKPNCGLKINK